MRIHSIYTTCLLCDMPILQNHHLCTLYQPYYRPRLMVEVRVGFRNFQQHFQLLTRLVVVLRWVCHVVKWACLVGCKSTHRPFSTKICPLGSLWIPKLLHRSKFAYSQHKANVITCICIQSNVRALSETSRRVSFSQVEDHEYSILNLRCCLLCSTYEYNSSRISLKCLGLSHERYLPRKHLGKVVSLRFLSLMRWPCLHKSL